MTRLAPAFCFAAAAILGGVTVARAGGLGAVAQVPSVSGLANRMAMPGNGAPFSIGVGAVSGAGINVTNSDGVTVQTNINSSRNVQGGSHVTVNETVNGVPVGYGMGDDFLAGANAQGQAALAQRRADIQQLENEIDLVVQVWHP